MGEITRDDNTGTVDTTHVWDSITKNGLRATGSEGACGPGIYLTKHAGLCRNSGGNPEFTTIHYGSARCKDLKVTRVVIVLTMKPQNATTICDAHRECGDWLLSDPADTLILKMYKTDTRKFAENVFLYDTTDIAKRTHVKSQILPDRKDKRRNRLMTLLRAASSDGS